MKDEEQTALNIAIASEKVWFNKMLDAQRERDQAKAEIAELRRELDELNIAYSRLETEFQRQETRLVIAGILRQHLDPFLPADLQDQARRTANPTLYANVKSRYQRF